MNWSKTLPSAEGWYWWWSPKLYPGDVQIAHVYRDDADAWRVDWYEPDGREHPEVKDFQGGSVEWAGPITPPPRPRGTTQPVLSDPDCPAVPLADLGALRTAAEPYTRPLDSITVRSEHEALARERLGPPTLWAEYHRLHAVCPRCGCASVEETCVGVVGPPPDRINKAKCVGCGWSGVVDDLRPGPE